MTAPLSPEDDLRPVLGNLLSDSGANGPDGPTTRAMLAAAAQHLAQGLSTAGGGPHRLLSALVGHETFTRKVMGISVHNMRRRWATAGDWYDDVIAYAIRPSRFDTYTQRSMQAAGEWAQRPLGEFMQLLVQDQARATRDAEGYRLSEALIAMWPDHPPIERCRLAEQEFVGSHWVPFYLIMLSHYGLQPNPDADWRSISYAGAALIGALAREGEPRLDSWVAEVGLYLVAAGSLNLDGTAPDLSELRHRLPVEQAT